MVLTQREKKIAIGLGVVLGILVIFEGVLKPYFDARSAAAADIDSALNTQMLDASTLAEQAKLQREYKQMIATGLVESQADAEEQIRTAIDQWSRACSVSENSLSDGQVQREGEFDQISFKLNGQGTTQNVAMLLNQCETTTLPLRIMQFVPKSTKEGRDFLGFELTVSTLYRRADGERLHSDSSTDAQPVKPVAFTVSEPRPLAPPYRILLTHSIFARDNRAAPDAPKHVAWHAPPATQATTVPTVVYNPDADYVLRGVGIQEGQYTALFEQLSKNQSVSRQPGEPISQGQIASMSLDGVEYVTGGKSAHIAIGQALDGTSRDASLSAPSGDSTPTSGRTSVWIHSHGEHTETATPPPAPAVSQPATPTTNPVDPNQKPPENPVPDDFGPDTVFIFGPQ